MATFPTLYYDSGSTRIHTPVVGELEDTMAADPAIRVNYEGGYTSARARYTRIVRKWRVVYEAAIATSMNTIKAFEDARVGGAGAFSWVSPEDGVTYTVRFLGLVVYRPWDKNYYKRWTITFVVEQV